jgi:undecaprenyl-diphosphatase
VQAAQTALTALTAPAADPIGAWHSVILGVVEGLTEFLPISSTGHLIVVNALLGRSDPTFEIAIQAGAITAILVLYWRDLVRAAAAMVRRRRAAAAAGQPRVNLLWLIAIGTAPAVLIGLPLARQLEALFHPVTVAVAMIGGGLLFLWVERWRDRRLAAGAPLETPLAAMTARQALVVGLWQVLALVPGTSRSGATILGGLVGGMSRQAAAEFSFLIGLPVLYGACLLKVAKDFDRASGPLLPDLLVASAAAFVAALVVVVGFVRFLQRHTFRPFAYYRIAAGALILAIYLR